MNYAIASPSESRIAGFLVFKENIQTKAWFPLNVSVIATNRSCLLARTLLGFAGFGLLQGLLYLEACKPRSAFGI